MNAAAVSFEACLDQAIAGLGGAAVEPPPRIPGSQRRRRGVQPADFSGLGAVTLIDDDGLLRWVYEPPPARMGLRRGRRARAVPSIDGVPIRTVPIADLPGNEVLAAIEALDRTLTPDRGLRLWRGGKLVPRPAKLDAKRVLLLVHGTFSKSDMFFAELASFAEGKAYLAAAEAEYDAIVAFDHPTLAVSPWINALDLEAAMAGVGGKIDVVCHSRGGLVVAWWLRMAKPNVANVVFVGSPLAGTSLASPAALREALDHLATAAKGIALASGAASAVVPLMSVVTGLAKTLGKVLQLGADLPLGDLAVVSVPGLAAQSRVRNNAEIVRLFASPWPKGPQLHAIIGNFRPKESDAGWRFWRRLSNIGDQVKYGAANLIFAAPNDLVVDTGCMLGELDAEANAAAAQAIAKVHALAFDEANLTRFENSPLVHHTNYFRQPQTVKALGAFL